MPDFIKCAECGKIFARESEETLCRNCRHEDTGPRTEREMLRDLRNYLRDCQAQGVMLTIDNLCEDTNIPPEMVWHFIHTGDLDLARFDDPAVKNYLLQKRREQERKLQDRAKEITTEAESKPLNRGFHLSDNDKRGR